MKVKELIERLKEMPQDMNVCIFDMRKNLFCGGGDSVCYGVEDIEAIEIVPDDETVKLMKEVGEEITQWVAIHYENDDYREDGKPDVNSLIADYYE